MNSLHFEIKRSKVEVTTKQNMVKRTGGHFEGHGFERKAHKLSGEQWRCQRSKGARSFRGQKILQPGYPDTPFPQKNWRPFLVVALKTQPPTPFHRQCKTNKAVKYGNIFIFCSHYYRNKAISRARQGGARAWARAVDLPAKSFDLVRPGVAPPLRAKARQNSHPSSDYLFWSVLYTFSYLLTYLLITINNI